MSGSDPETLTAALRRLADEHASGLLSVATPGPDVVLELADGVPVGIGPTHDVPARVGRDAGPSLVAAAVVDELVNRTVAAIVGGGGDWSWDVASDADMMPVPEGLGTELSRRAVDAAQALANLDADMVLQSGRDLEAHGEVARVRALFDGERSIEDVADAAELTLPATATLAAALVRAGVLSTGMDDGGPPRWTDTVADRDDEDDEDEPELWIMDEPDDVHLPEEPQEEQQQPQEQDAPSPAPAAQDPNAADGDIPQAMEWVAGEEGDPATSAPDDDGWDDTGWLDELDSREGRQPGDPSAEKGDEADVEDPHDIRSSLSSMISELQGSGSGSSQVQPRDQPPPAEPATSGDEDEDDRPTTTTDATRKEPKAEPGEVTEFLRELSRLALDDD